MCTKYGVDSSSRFPFRARTNRQTRLNALPTRATPAELLQPRGSAIAAIRCDALRQLKSCQHCRILHRFWTVARYWSKVANFNLPRLYLALPLGVTPFEFHGDLWHQNTNIPALLCGVVCVTLCLAVSVEYRLVTDSKNGRMDGQMGAGPQRNRAVKTTMTLSWLHISLLFCCTFRILKIASVCNN